jgi:integrase
LIQESSKETNRDRGLTAERQARNRLNDAYNGSRKRKAPIPFCTAAEKFIAGKRKLRPKSRVGMNGTLKHLLPVFGNTLLADITAEQITQYIDDRLAGAAPKTVVLEIGTLRGVLKKHRMWADLQQDVELPTVENEIGRKLEAEEEVALLRECAASRSRSLFTVVILALSTGLRRSELLVLRWLQIDFAQCSLRVGESKTKAGANRVVPLNARAHAVLTAWSLNFPDRKPQHFLWPAEKYGENGPYQTDVTQPIGSLKEAWEAAKKRAGVKCRFHDLRHTAATHMIDAGVPLRVVSSIMGWAPSTEVLMARRYAHPDQQAKAAAVQNLNGQTVGWLQNQIQSGGNPGGTIQ